MIQGHPDKLYISQHPESEQQSWTLKGRVHSQQVSGYIEQKYSFGQRAELSQCYITLMS